MNGMERIERRTEIALGVYSLEETIGWIEESRFGFGARLEVLINLMMA